MEQPDPLPLVSVIMPVRNGERYLRDAIRSVADQKYPNLEFIVVDGASTDGTLQILADASKELPALRFISEPDNGQSEAMNKGVRAAKGSIVGFINADDYYNPGAIHAAVRELSGMASPAMIIGDCTVHNLTKNTVEKSSPKVLGLEHLIYGDERHPANPTQYFYHRVIHDMIGPFPVEDHYAMDLWFFLEVFRHREIKLRYVPLSWGNFRLYAGTKTFDNLANSPAIRREYYERYRRYCRWPKSLAAYLRRKLRRLRNL